MVAPARPIIQALATISRHRMFPSGQAALMPTLVRLQRVRGRSGIHAGPKLPNATPCAVAIGTFDGVHLGHQALLARLCQAARVRDLEPAVLTFEPAPREWFARQRGEAVPTRISSLRDRIAQLAQCGVRRVGITRFDAELAALSAHDFIESVLVGQMGARHLFVGDDFRFGARRSGDYALLEALGPELGYTVERLDTVTNAAGARVSSSAIRRLLADGDLAGATTLLSTPWHLDGRVIHGAKLGRTLGFPTLNLRVPTAHPAAKGVFVVRVHGLAPTPLPAVASLGTRPVVEDAGRMLLETHLLDWRGNAYGQLIRVEFLHKLRDEARWEGPDALALLTAQIQRDAADARAWFAESLNL